MRVGPLRAGDGTPKRKLVALTNCGSLVVDALSPLTATRHAMSEAALL